MTHIQPELPNPVAKDVPCDIPCEAFFNEQWYLAKIIRELHLKTGVGQQICRVYLVEFDEHLRFWLSGSQVRQLSQERFEPKDV